MRLEKYLCTYVHSPTYKICLLLSWFILQRQKYNNNNNSINANRNLPAVRFTKEYLTANVFLPCAFCLQSQNRLCPTTHDQFAIWKMIPLHKFQLSHVNFSIQNFLFCASVISSRLFVFNIHLLMCCCCFLVFLTVFLFFSSYFCTWETYGNVAISTKGSKQQKK